MKNKWRQRAKRSIAFLTSAVLLLGSSPSGSMLSVWADAYPDQELFLEEDTDNIFIEEDSSGNQEPAGLSGQADQENSQENDQTNNQDLVLDDGSDLFLPADDETGTKQDGTEDENGTDDEDRTVDTTEESGFEEDTDFADGITDGDELAFTEEGAVMNALLLKAARAPEGTVQAQINEAKDEVQTIITLDHNVTESLVIPDEKNIILNLGGYTLSPSEEMREGSGEISAVTVFGTLTVQNGSIANTAGLSGVHGVTVAGGGSFTMESNVTISGFHTSGTGGGVMVQNYGRFIMNGGLIESNTAAGNGGGVFVYDGSGFVYNGGTIKNNHAENGGGVFLYSLSGGSFTLGEGCEISGNGAEVSGGGIYFNSNATVILQGNISVSENAGVEMGGGIYIGSNSSLTMEGSASVSENVGAEMGGGIYIGSNSALTMRGSASVSENTGARLGGGIYVGASSSFTMEGDSFVSNNSLRVGPSGTSNNKIDSIVSAGGGLYIGSKTAITLRGNAAVSENTGAGMGGGLYLDGSTILLMEDEAAVSDNSIASTSGTCMGAGICTTTQTGTITLRGYSRISGNKMLNAGNGGAIYADQGGPIILEEDAIIRDNEAKGGGGAIRTYGSGSKVIMRGNALVQNNKASSSCGAFYFTGGSLEMSGNSGIVGNTAGSIGGVFAGTVNMTDTAHITDNHASTGRAGGICGVDTMTTNIILSGDALIGGNTAAAQGGGLCPGVGVMNVTLSGNASVSGNTAGTYGGGINTNSGTIRLSGNATVSGNIAGTNGGGINSSGTVSLLENARLENNAAGTSGGAITAVTVKLTASEDGNSGVILENNHAGTVGGAMVATNVTIEDGMVRNNTAESAGGGVWLRENGTMTLSGGILYGNTAARGNDVFLSAKASASLAQADTLSGIDENGNRITGVSWQEEQSVTTTKEPVEITGEDTVHGYTLLLTESEYVARIGETLYPTVQDAVDAASEMQAEGSVLIEMLKSSRETVIIPGGTEIILDLCGYALRGNGGSVLTVEENADLILRDSSTSVTGKVTGGVGTAIDVGGKNCLYGGGLYVLGTFTLESGAVSGNTANYGGGIYVWGGTAILTGGTIENNKVAPGDLNSYSGGGVSVSWGGVLQMPEGSTVVIQNNTALDGGGVMIDGLNGSSRFEMEGGTVSENTASKSGGGVYLWAGGTLAMSGGEISGNKARNGGGLFTSQATGNRSNFFVMTGGEIINNTATAGGGGGINLGGQSNAKISEGRIEGNTAAGNGGGISLEYPSTLILEGATISGNTASSGGGISIARNCRVTMSGGSVTENSAVSGNGGGIAVTPFSAVLEVTGGDIYGNQSPLGTALDVYTVAGSSLTLTGVNMEEGSEYLYWYDVGDGSYMDKESGIIVPKAVRTYELTAVKSRPENDSVARIGGQYYNTLQKAVYAAVDQQKESGEEGKAITVHLVKDVNETVSVPASFNIILNLNGYTLTGAGKMQNVILNHGNLTLTDERDTEKEDYKPGSDGGVITMAEGAEKGRALTVYTGASFTMKGGTIQGFHGLTYGGALRVYAGGTVTLDGGTLQENQADNGGAISSINEGGSNLVTSITINEDSSLIGNTAKNGGAVYFNNSSAGNKTLTVNGGVLEKNTAEADGGAIYTAYMNAYVKGGAIKNNSGNRGGGIFSGNSVSLIMDGGFVQNNKAVTGGGVFSGATFTMNDGVISENHASGNGGGIGTTVHRVYFHLNGGRIEKNTAGGSGGGLATSDECYIYVNGVKILNNTAAGSGGGIYRYNYGGGIFTIDGDSEISGNQAGYMGGGIYAGYKLTINNGKISGNTAVAGGGAIYAWITTIEINGGELSGNRVTGGSGGAIYGRWYNIIMTDGLISNNTASGSGGAFFLYAENGDKRTSRISGGKITGNRAAYGGAIYCMSGADLVMSGGICTDNHASGYGGGVYVYYQRASLTLSENGLLYGNDAALGRDIYANYAAGWTGKDVFLKLRDPVEMMAGIGVTGIGWYDEARETLIPEAISYNPIIRTYPLTLLYHTEEPVAFIGNQGYTTLASAMEAVANKTYPGATESTEPPVIHMVKNIVETVEVPRGVSAVLNLNGYTLNGVTRAINCYGDLTIKDEKQVILSKDGTTYPAGNGTGTITGHAESKGGGIYVPYGGFVKMESGRIADCIVRNNANDTSIGGAGVYIDGGSFELTKDAVIQNCQAKYGAAVLAYGGSSVLRMSGGIVENNQTKSGNGLTIGSGTIFINSASFYMEEGTIRNNQASGYGGGIYLTGTGIAILTDGKILENKAQNSGGGIYQSSGTLQISGGEIRDNQVISRSTSYTASSGGGIYQNSGSLLIQGDTLISGNSAKWGGAIAQYNGKTQVLGGRITGNKAQFGGGLSQYAEKPAIFTLIGGLLAGNYATITGSGNDVYSLYEGTKDYEFVNKATKPRATLLPAAEMGSTAYNVWRDDTYSGDPFVREAEALDSVPRGQHITGLINEGNNLMLTAVHYGDTAYEEKSTDLAVTDFIIQSKTGKEGMTDGTAVFDTEKKAEERTAKEMLEAREPGWQQSDEVYFYNDPAKEHPLKKITYTGTEYRQGDYEQEQAAVWSPGDDSGAGNSIVRTFDKVTYVLSANVQRPKEDQDEDSNGEDDDKEDTGDDKEDASGEVKKHRIWFEAELPCSGDEIQFESSNLKFYYTYTDEEGHPVLKGYTEMELADDQTGTLETTLSFKIMGMKNGDTVKPVFRAWVEGNEVNEENPAVCQSKILTISAAPRYNVVLRKNSSLAYTSYFDLETGQESSEEEQDKENVVYGTMLGYGITVELMNNKTNKELKGIELPQGDLEFELRQGATLYLDGRPLLDEEGNPVKSTPYLWAYKDNNSNTYGTGASGGRFNMDWNDEDDLARTTQYGYDAAPYNNGARANACYGGGSWKVSVISTPESETLTTRLAISDYAVKTAVAKVTQTSNGAASTLFNSSYIWAFSAGYLQVICPVDPELAGENKDGYLQINMESVVSNLEARGMSGQEPESGTQGLELMKTVFGDDYYEGMDLRPGAYRDHAVHEMNYEDNYLSESSGLYIFSGEGTGDNIEKTNYFRKNDRSVLVYDSGIGSTPLGSQTYISADLHYYSREYRTDDPEDPAHYIEPDDFDPQKDNVLEYNYMTSMDLLQKFDADGFTPLDCEKIDQRFNLSSQSNVFGGAGKNVFSITTSETATTWSQTNPIQTMSYDLKILYAAKPDGTNWKKEPLTDSAGNPILDDKGRQEDDGGVADMDSHRMDSNGDNQLLYFDTLQELYSYFEGKGIMDAKCVGILYQFRNCCIRNGRQITVSSRMQMNNDFEEIGKTYCTTNDVRCWSTYRPEYKENRTAGTLKDILHTATVKANDVSGVVQSYVYDQGDGESKDTISAHKEWDGYIKTRYKDGFQVKGTHNGWLSGNTLLLYTLDSTINITNTDLKANSNAVKETYVVSNGERTANFKVTPSLNFSSGTSNHALVANGTKASEVEIKLAFPEHLHYNEGSLEFDYSKSGYTVNNMSWTVEYVEKEDGTSELILKTKVSDITKKLPTFTYNCTIGTPGASEQDDVPSGEALITVAAIKSSYDETNRVTGPSHQDTVSIIALRAGEDVISKNVEEKLVELGEDLVYNLYYNNRNQDSTKVELCDILPNVNDGRGTSFHGGYRLKGVELYFPSEEDRTDYLNGKDGITGSLKYTADPNLKISWGSESASAQERIVLDGAAQEGSWEEIKAVPVPSEDGYKLTYDLSSQNLIRKSSAEGTTLSALYFNLPSISSGELRIRLILSPMQNKTSLITDSSKKTQAGGDIYWNNFFYRSGGSELPPVTSGMCSVKTIERTLSGITWLDQDRDGIYSTVTQSTDDPMQLMDVYLCAKAEQPENLYATDGNGNKMEVATVGGVTYYQVKDILGNTILPAQTTEKGEYSFTNLQQGTYYVLIKDDSSNYIGIKAKGQPIPFNRLSVTPGRSDAEIFYTTSSAATDKAKPYYEAVDTESGPAELTWAVIANAGQGITLPAKNEIKIAHYVTSNWNAGFCYTDLTLAKIWKNLYDLPEEGTGVKFSLTASTKQKTQEGTSGIPEETQGFDWKPTVTLNQNNNKVAVSTGPDESPGLNLQRFTNPDKFPAFAEVDNNIAKDNTLTWKLAHMALQAEGSSGLITWGEVTERATDQTGNLLGGFIQSAQDDYNDTETERTVTAYNTQILYDLDLTKVSRAVENQEPHPLKNAEFTLYTEEACMKPAKKPGTTEDFVLTSGENGTLSFGNLPSGTYYLKETKTPSGYRINKAVYEILISYNTGAGTGTDPDEGTGTDTGTGSTVDKENALTTPVIEVKVLTDEKTGDELDTPILLVKDTDLTITPGAPADGEVTEGRPSYTHYSIRFEVEDECIYELPRTGGRGVLWNLITGVALMMAALWLVNRKKRMLF